MGEWTAGGRPYGNDVDPKTHQLVVNEIEAPLVPMIFDLYDNKKLGAQNIARLLTERGHRTRAGRPWGNRAILTILRNRAYIGEIFFRDQYHPAPHQRLFAFFRG